MSFCLLRFAAKPLASKITIPTMTRSTTFVVMSLLSNLGSCELYRIVDAMNLAVVISPSHK